MTDLPFREAREAVALDRFWDRAMENPSLAPRDVALEDAATIHAFQDLARQPSAPDPAFLARLEDQIMLGQRSILASPGNPFTSGRLLSPALRPPAPATSPHRVRGGLQLVAVAAVVVMVLGLALVSLPRQEPAAPPLHLSALTASSTPEIATSETLLVVPLADAMEPTINGVSGDRVTTWSLWTVEAAPETNAIWDAQHAACCPGPRFEYVLKGTYRVRADAPMQVIRANNPSAPEVVPVGTEVTLGPGDARISRNTDAFTAVNGDTPLQLLLGYMIIDEPYNEPVPGGWVFPTGTWQMVQTPASKWSMVPPDLGALQFRLERTTLAPDETLPRANGVIGQLAVSTVPDSAIATRGDGSVRNIGATPLTVYVLALEPRDP